MKNIKPDSSTEKIYVNSYTMSTTGSNDVQFTVNLGRNYNARSVQLDYASLDTLFTTFYPSQQKDFTSFTVTNSAGISETLTCNYYISSLADFMSWFNATISGATGLTITSLARKSVF